MRHRLSGRVTWAPSPVGDAVRASLDGRLRRFVRDEESEPVVLFSPEARAVSDAGDWYGEHLGKWLVAASHAFRRTGDAELGEAIRRTVERVVAWQEPDGYLGTYAPGADCRMTAPGAGGVRTWDLWVHAWTVLGLLAVPPLPSGGEGPGVRGGEIGTCSEGATAPHPALPPLGHDHPQRGEALEAAVRVGDLILETFAERSPLDQGNHAGLSAGVIVHPLAELTLATGDPRYADFALGVVDEMEVRLGLLSKADVAEIGTGKAYQILWVLVGLVALHRAMGRADLLATAQRLWANVHDHHLTPLGGPWGGIQGHKETFAPKGAFSPYGMVETCSAATWMALSRDLFALTGDPRYVEAFERTLMNALLGALDENGRDWVYFTFPNGRRNNTYHWACCRSSGAMALEACSDMVASATDDAVWLHLLLPCRVEIEGCVVEVGEDLTIRYAGDRPLKVRVPEWAEGGGAYVEIESNPTPSTWGATSSHPSADPPPQGEGIPSPPDRRGSSASSQVMASPLGEGRVGVVLRLVRPIKLTPFTHTVDHHGQEIVRQDYAYLQRGPCVYATGLIDGYKREETLRLARLTPEAPFRVDGEDVLFHQPGREPIRFEPYWRAGGRHEGAWRTTWLGIAWQ